jgi:hypothetical protein
MTCYVIRKHIHRGQIQTLWEFDAATEAEARRLFVSCIVEMLEADDTGHYLSHSYIETEGGWVDESCALPYMREDILPAIPSWYEGPGIYDESDNLVILYSDENTDRMTLGDWDYSLALPA